MLISVFVPFANEEGNLPELIERIELGAKIAGVGVELVMVDDGSRDGSFAAATEISKDKPWIKLLKHRVNRGLTEAMKTGFAHCSGEIIVFLPSDLESHPDEDIPALLEGFKSGADVVCGRRKGRKDGKLALSFIYNIVSKTLFNMTLHDMNWIKAFKADCLEDLELRSDWHRFIAQILHEKGYKITEVPVNWHKRKSGKSHFGLKRIPIAFFDSLAVKFILTFTKAPMRFFGTVGLLQILSALGIGSWFIYAKFILNENILRNRPLLYFLVMLFLSGIIFFFMGFIAELIVSLKDEIKRGSRDD